MTDVRDKTTKVFVKLLDKKMDMDMDHIMEWAVDIEAGIFQATTESTKSEVQLILNLFDTGTRYPDLWQKEKAGPVNPLDLEAQQQLL